MNLVAQIAMAAAGAEHHGDIQAQTFIFGVIAAIIFGVMGLVVFSYRNVANRHSAKAEAWAARHGKDHEAGGGH